MAVRVSSAYADGADRNINAAHRIAPSRRKPLRFMPPEFLNDPNDPAPLAGRWAAVLVRHDDT